MVYKKYSSRAGKKYGPYLYENKRVGKKVVTNYIGKSSDNFGRRTFVAGFITILVIALIFSFFTYNNKFSTGKVVIEADNTIYKIGDPLVGEVKFNLRQGELIPKDADVVVQNDGETKHILMSEFSPEADLTTGNFYADGLHITGNGQGYGVIGKRILHPTINFQLSITNSGDSGNANIINAQTSADNPFNYNLNSGQTASIVPGSANVNGEQIDDGNIVLQNNDNNVLVSTSYSTNESGFGQGYLGNYVLSLPLDLSNLGLTVQASDIKISLVYQDQVIAQVLKQVNVIGSSENQSNNQSNSQSSSQSDSSSGSSSSGSSTPVIPDSNSTGIEVKTTKQRIKLGESVKWTKKIILDSPKVVDVNLPSLAENISVDKIENGEVKDASVSITGQVTIDLKLGKEPKIVTWFKSLLKKITGRVITDTADVVQVSLQDNATEYNIQYETPAPTSTELATGDGKKVIISAPTELGYTDVLSYADIPEKLKVGEENKISIYWEENKSYIPFNASDSDGNGLLDYVEWNTPHLSSQTFDISISGNKQIQSGNPITDCTTISSGGEYDLLNNIGNGGTCLTITADNVTINGKGNVVTGDISGSGDSSEVMGSTGNSGHTFTLNNIIVNGFVNSNGGDCNYYCHGGNGGNVTMISSTITEFDSKGGVASDGFGGSIQGAIHSGSGGMLVLINSNVSSVNISGTDTGADGAGGNGGKLISTSSLIYSIHAIGGGGAGGNGIGGNVTFTDCPFSPKPTINVGSDGTISPANWNSCVALTPILSCQTISSPGNYTLLANIGSGGTCLTINTEGVVVNGNGNTITGNVVGDRVGYSAPGYSFNLTNIKVIGNVSSSGQTDDGCSDYCGGGRGGNITITDSNITSVLSTSLIGGDSGGSGGTILIANSNLLSAMSNGANGASNGGNAGKVIVINSNINNLFTLGGIGCGVDCGGDGAGGIITVTNSTIVNSTSSGGAGAITILNSNATFVTSSSNITITNSNLSSSGLIMGGEKITINNLTLDLSVIQADGATIVLNQTFFYNSNGTVKFNSIITTTISPSSAIKINNNSIYISDTTDYNKSANVTLFNVPTNFTHPVILRDGVVCKDCVNYTSLNSGSVTFSVTSWSNYTIGESVNYSEIATLEAGWNMFSITTNTSDTGTDRNIPLSAGWNLIGYSAIDDVAQSSATFPSTGGVRMSVRNAAKNGDIQNQFASYDSSSHRYLYTPLSDSDLRTNKGYWVYVNQSGNLTIPAVGGSYTNETYNWADLYFSNGTDIKNITDAYDAGWVGISGSFGGMIQYWDTSIVGGGLGRNIFEDIPLNPWQGYWIYSNQNGIIMLRKN